MIQTRKMIENHLKRECEQILAAYRILKGQYESEHLRQDWTDEKIMHFFVKESTTFNTVAYEFAAFVNQEMSILFSSEATNFAASEGPEQSYNLQLTRQKLFDILNAMRGHPVL